MTFEEFKSEHVIVKHKRTVDRFTGQTVLKTTVLLGDTCGVKSGISNEVIDTYGEEVFKTYEDGNEETAVKNMWNYLKKEFGSSDAEKEDE